MPILTTCKEAVQVFEATEMDGLVIENEYIKKKYE
jgi:predicted NodU family carbamoyl transferase